MRKNIRKLLLCLIMTVCVITGCKKEKEEARIPTENVQQIENISDKIKCTDSKYGLYDITDKLVTDKEYIYKVCFTDDKRLIVLVAKDGEEMITDCILYDYSKDEIIGKDTVDGYIDEVYISKENIFLHYDLKKKIGRYTDKLEKIDDMELEYDDSQYSFAYEKNKNILYMLSETGGNLEAINLSDKSTRILNVSGKCDDAIILGYSDLYENLIIRYNHGNDYWNTALINIATGNIIENENYDEGKFYENIFIPNTDTSSSIVWRDINRPRVENKIYIDYEYGDQSCKYIDRSQTYAVVAENGVTSDDKGIIFSIYNVKTGKKEIQINKEYIKDTLKWTSVTVPYYSYENNQVIPLDVYIDGKSKLYLMDIAKATEKAKDGDDLVCIDEIDTNDRIAVKVKELEKKFNINIKYGTDVVRDYPDFSATQAMDEDNVYNTLVEIDNVFSRCPEGFFNYFKKYSKGLYIYLSGQLVQRASGGISSPAAFTLEYDNEQMIVVDVQYIWSMSVTLTHELSHAIDTYIEHKANEETGFNGYGEEWYKLNPEDYDYAYAYQIDGEDISPVNRPLYTWDDSRYNKDKNIVYFATGYGSTFPTEDRSTIFEYLLGYGEDETLPDFYQSSHIRAKAEFMFKTIRAAFEIKDTEEVYWEHWW